MIFSKLSLLKLLLAYLKLGALEILNLHGFDLEYQSLLFKLY